MPGPTGEIVAAANDKEEAVLIAQFDLDKIKSKRSSWGIFRDRRPDLYKVLLTFDGSKPSSWFRALLLSRCCCRDNQWEFLSLPCPIFKLGKNRMTYLDDFHKYEIKNINKKNQNFRVWYCLCCWPVSQLLSSSSQHHRLGMYIAAPLGRGKDGTLPLFSKAAQSQYWLHPGGPELSIWRILTCKLCLVDHFIVASSGPKLYQFYLFLFWYPNLFFFLSLLLSKWISLIPKFCLLAIHQRYNLSFEIVLKFLIFSEGGCDILVL